MKKQCVCLLLCAGLVTFAWANQVSIEANDARGLAVAAADAKAGDTILVPPGTYNLISSICSEIADSFKGNGRDKGCLWVGGKSGKRTTKDNPIMIVGTDPANPPNIIGPGTGSNYYTAHITENYVYFKNLKLSQGSKVLIIDYAKDVIVEDCELTGSGTELLHVRDSSQNVVINRNFIHGSGLVTGMYGEGVYVGTYPGNWYTRNSDDRAKLKTPDKTGYDWRVNGTQITCNVIKATTAEPIDVKEGVDGVHIKKNMFVADWLATESGAPSYDDAYIDMKGRNAVVDSNYMYDSKDAYLPYYNVKFKYFVEEVANKDANAVAWENATGIKVRPDGYTSTGWCDNSASDNNKCFAASNNVVKEIRDVRNDCDEILSFPDGSKITYSDVNFAVTDEARLPGAITSSSSAKSSSSVQSSSSAKSSSSSAKSSSSVKSSSSQQSSSSVATSSSASSSSNSGGTTKTTRYEAENATIGTGADTWSASSASGNRYVRGKTGDITFAVNVANEGDCYVTIRYNQTSGAETKTQDIVVNETKVMSVVFPYTVLENRWQNPVWKDTIITIHLKEGSNTIGFIKNWGYVDLDYIEITEQVALSSSSAKSSSSSAKSSSSVKSSSSQQSSSSAKSSSSAVSSSSAAQSSSSVASSSSAKSSSSSVEAVEQSSSSDIFSSSTQAVEPQTSSSMEVLESSSSETYSPGLDDLINDESSSSSYEISSSDSNEQGLVVVLPGKYAMVPVLGKVFRLKVPSSEDYRVDVFDYNGNVVRQLHSGRYIIRVESRNYNYVTSVIVK